MLLIKNAVHLGAPVDLLINGTAIAAMTPAGHCDYGHVGQIVDADGLLLLPALIDCHAHLREPGHEYKEDIASGLEAAARGGFGAVMCMANTKPVNDSAAITAFMLQRARTAHPAGPALYPIAAATCGLAGETMAPIAELREAGCIAVSNDGRPLANAELVRRIMEYAADLGMIFIDHCEDPHLARGWIMHEGATSGRLGVKGQPGAGEAMQAARDIMLAELLNLPVHIAHVSSALTVDILAWAKERDVKVTAETCLHYLLLDDSAMDGYNSLAKVSPPLRTPADREALRKAVKSGIIDILVTDHAPHASHEKNNALDAAPFGMTGLDLALPLSFRLVEQSILSEADIHRLWLKRPAEIFGLPRNDFDPGDPADFMLYDPNTTWKVEPENLYSKSSNTPFLHETMQGRARHLWLGGRQIY